MLKGLLELASHGDLSVPVSLSLPLSGVVNGACLFGMLTLMHNSEGIEGLIQPLLQIDPFSL